MGKRDETLTFLRSGISPGAIRRIQGVTLSTILGYLDELIGRGRLRRSDIFFSVPLQVRHALFNLISGKKQLSRDSRRLVLSPDLFETGSLGLCEI